MSLVRTVQLCALLAMVICGCKSPSTRVTSQVEPLPGGALLAHQMLPQPEEPFLANVSFEEQLPTEPDESGQERVSQRELSLAQLIDDVQARNPSLQAMAAAWQSAAQRYPQAVSLDDPMFMAMVAPDSFDSNDVDPGYALQGSQKFPWFGKRAARGRQARAEANAAYHDLQDSRLRLIEITRTAFYEFYLARRQLDLNQTNQEIIRQFRSTAQSKYEANQVTQQDVLQADVELAELERRGIELERMDRIAVARINTLLREDPFSPLPRPPERLDPPSDELDVSVLQQLALNRRPDLAALSARVRAEQAAVTLACKNYYPDTEVFGRYDAFWQEPPLQTAVGVNLNVPIYRGRLNAAVREARYTLSQRRAEYEQLVLDVQYEVVSTFQQVEESRRTLQLYDERLIPAVEQNVAAARANYDVNKASFLDLAIAQRQLIELRETREVALAAYHNRLAELARVVGGSVSGVAEAEQIPAPATE